MARMPNRMFRRLCASAAATAALAAAPSGAAAATGEMTFVERHVSTALTEGIDGSRNLGNGLYEPSIVAAPCPPTRCEDGVVLYLTAHAPGALATRSSAFYSHDRGKSWHNMPGFTPTGSTRPVGGVHGAEADFAADGTGRAWLFDAGSAVAPLYGFCGHGQEQCSYVPTMNEDSCGPNYLTDRPWLAYGAGKLLLVANAGHLPPFSIQLGIYDPDGDPPASNVDWNACNVGASGIHGHPAVSPSGDFVVPHVIHSPDRARLWLTEGSVHTGVGADQLTRTAVADMSFPAFNQAGCNGGALWGYSAFDSGGTKYVTMASSPTEFAVAAGAPGQPLATRSFDAHGDIGFLWMSGSQRGDGALVTWTVTRECTPDPREPTYPGVDRSDVYAGHIRLVDGVPTLVEEAKVAENVIGIDGDYIGSWLGPDGRGYIANYSADSHRPLPGTEPLSVFVQTGGPTL